jgi:hypothetical protein
MEFGIFNLMGSRDPAKPTAEVFAEVAEQTRLADELGIGSPGSPSIISRTIASVASPLMIVAHCIWPPKFYVPVIRIGGGWSSSGLPRPQGS